MVRFLPFVCLLVFSTAHAQKRELSVNDLVRSAFVPGDKMNGYVSKLGFQTKKSFLNSEDNHVTFANKPGKDKIARLLSKYENNNGTVVVFETTSEDEYKQLKAELLDNGFKKVISRRGPEEYQRENLVIKALAPKADSGIFQFQIERKVLPSLTELVYAEDLLAFSSHEYLVSVFGQANVKKDTFFFSEDEYNVCSIVYPNTFSQAVLLWKDEKNFRELAFIIIGEKWDADKSFLGLNQTRQNKWQSRKGVYIGMALSDFVQLNSQHVSLFGWSSEQPGFVTFDSRGKLDFKKLGLQFTCLDCKADRFYSKTNVIRSEALLSQRSRVYIDKIIILPNDR